MTMDALREAERFLAYFAGETGGSFEGPGTPKTALAKVREALRTQPAEAGVTENALWSWRCGCGCRTFSWVDEKSPGQDSYQPGPLVRCLDCKAVTTHPAALVPTPATQGMDTAVEAVATKQKVDPIITDLLTASDLLSARWKAQSKEVSKRLFKHANTLSDILSALVPVEDGAIAAELRSTTEEMASACSVPMELWDRHSNAALKAVAALTAAYPHMTGAAQEAVAWRYRYNGRWYVCDSEEFAQKGLDAHPLYATPQPAPSSADAGMLAAREAFLNLMADANKWHTETDEGGTIHTIETSDSQLKDLAEALGIKTKWAEPTEDAIARAIDYGPSPALAAATASPVQPEAEGWVLVPVEPTPEMYGAGGVEQFKCDLAMTPVREAVGKVYRAMLSAAPKQGGE